MENGVGVSLKEGVSSSNDGLIRENGVGLGLKKEISSSNDGLIREDEVPIPIDEVFEEAVQFIQDDDDDAFKLDSVANDQTTLSSSFFEGNSRLGDQEETANVEGSNEETHAGETESREKKDAPLVFNGHDTVSRVDDQQVEHEDTKLLIDVVNDEALDNRDVHDKEGHHLATSLSDDATHIGDVNEEALDNRDVHDNERHNLATSLSDDATHNGDVNEEALDNRDVHDKEGLHLATSLSDDATHNGDVNEEALDNRDVHDKEGLHLATSLSDDATHNGDVNEEALDNRDVHDNERHNLATSLSDEATHNGDVNRVRENEDSEDQLEKRLPDFATALVEGTSANTNFELDGSNGVAAGGSQTVQPEDSQTTSHGGHNVEEVPNDEVFEEAVGDFRDEETSSVDNVAKGSETQELTPRLQSSSGSLQLMSSGISVVDRQDSAKGRTVEAEKREEITKPSQSSVRSSEKPANPTIPPTRPAGLGSAAPLLGPGHRAANQPRANGQQSQVHSNAAEDTNDGEVEEGDEVRQKLQMIRVKFLRLAHRLGQTPHNVVVAQVLYRLGLAEQLRARSGGRYGAFSFDRASAMAEQLEATAQEPLDFSCTIMVIGKTGVGKSATINSIFDEVKFNTDAFQMGTKKVQDIVGTVQGIKVRVIDTPGLLSCCVDQRQNEKILNSVKRFIKTSPPDIVLYLDRLDMPSRDFADMPLLRTITEIFGPSIWFNAIVVLTHAASAPPEGPNGTTSTYDMFVTQRSHAVQQAIRQAAGDMRLMNPVSLVENHSACRTNTAGQRVLPNGQVWKPHLLLLSFASKILAEANTLLKLQDTPSGKTSTPRSRAPPLPFLLSSLLQSKPHLKLPEEQFADDDAIDDELDDSSESDDEPDYDELPPFKPLTKAQLAKLSKTQKKAYYDEIEYREKLLMKKQLKEKKRRRKLMKQMAAAAKDMLGEHTENVEEESEGAASVPVPMPDLSLPTSFDSDNPTHRYRHLDTSNQWLVRPVLDTHGWDHDVGYEGINVERMFVVKDTIPLSFSGQVSKDKKESNLQMEVASSINHGEGKATTLGFDMQSVGKDMAYTLRSESRFSNYVHNKATVGLSATLLGDSISAGVKLEDKLIANKQFKVVMSGGAMASRGDVAYGGSLEATLRDKDFPLGRFLSTLGLSVMDWHGELALGCNIQTQIPVGRSTNLIARANLNNRGSGQLSLRLNSSEQVQLALIGLIPLIRRLVGEYQGHSFVQ